jgi:hypothetical protein
MAGTRTGTVRISRQRARVLRQEVIGRHPRMLRHTTIVEVAAPMRRLRVPIPHRAAAIRRRRARIRRQAGIIQLRRVRIPHQRAAVIPHLRTLRRAELIPRRAVAMVAEAGVAVEAEAEEVHRPVEAAREAAGARAETGRTDAKLYS